MLVYRISYGEDTIPKAAESDYQSCNIKTKTFIPPEYREYHNKIHQLPTFLKEKLYEETKSKRPVKHTPTPLMEEAILQPQDQTYERNMTSTTTKSESLPALNPNRRLVSHAISMNNLGKVKLG